MNRLLFLLLLLFYDIVAFPQQYLFQTYSIEEGLSQSVVNCVYQDSRGLIWIGTQNGLNRFNGYDFTVFLYNPDDTCSISNNWIYAITEDGNGNLWIGTKGGLNQYLREANRFRRISYATGFATHLAGCVYDVLVSKSGKIYINTPPVLSVFNPVKNEFQHYRANIPFGGAVNDNRIPLLEDHDGEIWMGTPNGLMHFNPQSSTFTSYFHDPGRTGTLCDNNITALYQDNKGTIWIGTGNGLDLLKKPTCEILGIFNLPPSRQIIGNSCIRAITQDPGGAVWIGTEGEGLCRIENHENQSYLIDRFTSPRHGLGHNIILALIIDNSRNLWAGTLKGISKTDLKPAKFKLYRKDNTTASVDLQGNVIASIFKDEKGKIWIGNWGQGLNIYNRTTGEVTHYSSKLSGNRFITNDFVHTIFCDEHKNIWIGTRDGIHVYDEKTEKFLPYRVFFHNKNLPDLTGVRVNMIIRGADNSYWIATQNGLFRIHPERTSYEVFNAEATDNHKIGGNLIYCIKEGSDGSIWIATLNGLDVFNPNNLKMTHFRKSESKNSLCDNFVISLCEDGQGNMWIGTGSYVNKFIKKDSTFLYYSKEHGLPNNNIFEILMDNNNTCWFATGGGLCKFDTTTASFRTYTVDDGLQGLEFNLRACYNSSDGEIFFGGMNGFNSFYPGSLEDNPNIPEIMITSCYKSTKNGRVYLDFDKRGEVVLDPSDQAFTIEFVALEFTNPQKNQYAYKLEGLSDEWITIGNRRFVPFSNLSPGVYIFKVKGSNNDGIWNEAGCALKIVVLPPWWRSWWAWMAYLLIIAGSVVVYIRMREKKLVRERDQLEKKVAERTLQIEKNNIEILHKNETLNELNSELKALNATKDKFFSIIAHDLRNPFNSILGLTDIVLGNLDNPDPPKIRKTITDIRDASRHAYDLLQNLLIWARSQTGNLTFQPSLFDLMERVQDNIELVMGQASRKNITLVSEIDKPLPVYGDIQMINTVLRNLLTNAIKFTARDGCVVITAEKSDGLCLIRVQDNGTGITPEILSKIFKIESKYTKKGTEMERGTGLGLILCKEFVEKHEGHIRVETEPGKGSAFTIALPLQPVSGN